MSTTKHLIGIIIFICIQIQAQWGYHHHFIQKDYYAIEFVSEDVGFLGGEQLFAMTNNEGASWFNISRIFGDEVLSIDFLDENIGIAVGQYYTYGPGFIYYTSDGGFNWSVAYYQTYAYAAVKDVYLLDDSHGWAVGDDGNIFRIVYGIDHWSYVTSLPVDLLSVYFINQDIGWTSGWGKLYKSTNGGVSWFEKQTGVNTRIWDVLFLDQNVGWATAYPNILLHSTDGGETWTNTTASIPFVYKLCFLSDSLGFVTGNSYVLKTTDGGINWTSVLIPGASWFEGISFVNDSVGYIAGRYNKIFKTSNSGETWDEMMLAEFNNLNSIDMYSLTRGVAVGNNGAILKRNNDSWFSGITSTTKNLNSVYTFSSSSSIAVGDSGIIIKSTDSYLHWTEKYSGVNVNLKSVQFINYYLGWAVGENGTVLKSISAGDSWVTVSSGYFEDFNSVFFISSSIGWISGNNGLIIKTTDGGLTWTPENSSLTSKILKIQFCDENIGFALAQGGIILRTDDGGMTWNIIYDLQPSYELYELKFFSTTRGWACGQFGYIYRTTDGGYSWTPQFSSPTTDLRSINIIDSNNVYAAGDDGVILYTSNGGQGPPVPVELTSFTAFSRNNQVVLNWSTATELNNYIFEIERKTADQEYYTIGYVEGNGSTAEPHEYSYDDKNVERGKYHYRLKQIDYIGSYMYSKEVEVDVTGIITFSLYQNFPNPFNPSTKIKYEIPAVGTRDRVSVQLKVYDVLGNEVATLVNEEKQPGTYEVEFSTNSHSGESRKLTSGIYFYQLKSGNFVETKKMILLK